MNLSFDIDVISDLTSFSRQLCLLVGGSVIVRKGWVQNWGFELDFGDYLRLVLF